MESRAADSLGSRAEPWIALALCAAVLAAWATGAARSQPAGLRRDLRSGLAPPRRRRARRGGDHAIEWSPPVAAPTTRADLERSPADGVGSQWTAVRPASHRGPHPTRRSTGRGWRLGRWLSPPPSCSRVSPWRARPTPRPPASQVHPRVSWYGYAAFVLALPYPVLRTWWALGGTPGLDVARRGRRGLRPMAACYPVAAGGRSVPAAGANAALDAAPAVAGCRLVRHRHRRHDRAGGLLVAGHRVSRAAAILAQGASRPGSLVSSTAAGSSGP